MSASPPTGTISQEYQQYIDKFEPDIYQVYLLRLMEKAALVYQNKMTEAEYQAPFDPSGVIPGTTREVTEQPLSALGFHLPSSLDLLISNDIEESAMVSYPIASEMLPHLKVGHIVYYLTQLLQQQHTFRRQDVEYVKKVGDALFDAQKEHLAYPKGYPFSSGTKDGPYIFYFQSTANADKDFFHHFNEIQSYAWDEASDMYEWFFQDELGLVEFVDLYPYIPNTRQRKTVDPLEDWRNTVESTMEDYGIPEDKRTLLSVFTEYEIKLAIALRKLTIDDFKDFVNPEVPYVKEEEDAVDEYGNKVLDDEGYIATVQVDRPVVGEEALQSLSADEDSFLHVTAYLRDKGLL